VPIIVSFTSKIGIPFQFNQSSEGLPWKPCPWSQTLDFIHVEDVTRTYILAAKTDFIDAVFNVGSGEETSLRSLAELLLKVMESDLHPEYGPERKVNGVPRRLADISSA
jgi:UDP-glucose 4-epimerase